MMPFEDILIQLVDLPPVATDFYEPWIGGIIRQADLAWLVVDLGSDDLLEEVEDVLRILDGSRIALAGKPATSGTAAEVIRPALIAANKLDAGNARENLQILEEFFSARFQIFPVSAATGEDLDRLRLISFERLDIIRVYTKAPGKKLDPASAPFVLKHGGTVLDAARAVHRDFAHTLRFARVWSSRHSRRSIKFDGQMVERTHPLEDGDILEIHA